MVVTAVMRACDGGGRKEGHRQVAAVVVRSWWEGGGQGGRGSAIITLTLSQTLPHRALPRAPRAVPGWRKNWVEVRRASPHTVHSMRP